MPARPLLHVDGEKKDDETLRAEARAHLADSPSLQLVAELLQRLRAADLPFWLPEGLRSRWNAAERMRWFRQRPDIRQRITTGLTGLAPKAARKKMAEFQAALIDSVIDEGDVPVRAFEESFEPADVAVYGSAAAFWHGFRELFPWRDDAPVHQEFIAWLLKALLADASSIAGMGRVPILTAWDLRTAIDGRVWHTKIPIEVRVAIDDARFSQERDRPGVPFHAQDDLAIAVPDIIAASVPLRDLAGVFDAAERAMGFDKEAPRPKGPPELRPPTESKAPDGRPRESMAPNVPPTLAPPASIAPAAAIPPAAPVPAIDAPPPDPPPAPPPPAQPIDPTPPPAAASAAILPMPELRRGPTPGVPTLEDELERTNPWVVPSAEELAAAAASDDPPSYHPEALSPRKRRR